MEKRNGCEVLGQEEIFEGIRCVHDLDHGEGFRTSCACVCANWSHSKLKICAVYYQ